MKIIISGDGEVGFYLAKLLEREYRDIILIDTQKDKLEFVEKELGIATVLGDSTSYKTLIEAGIQDSDLLLAVTSNESSNILTCIIGKKFGAKYAIARVSNLEFINGKPTQVMKEIGIDNLISPEMLAASEIHDILRTPALNEIISLEGDLLTVFGLNINSQSCFANKTSVDIEKLVPSASFNISAIQRAGKTLFPDKSFCIENGDNVYFMTTNGGYLKIMELAGKKNSQIKNILIIGGSRTGQYTAMKLSKYSSVKIIEKDFEKCNKIALQLPKIQIVCGDGTNVKLLHEEKIEQYDAIISVTGNSETNIFSCLIGKEAGVKKAIAMVDNIGLFDYSQKMGIDTLVNKKLAAANYIFKNIHKSGVLSHLYGVEAEIQEFIVTKGAKISYKTLKDLKLPDDIKICGTVRNNNGYIVNEDFEFLPEDKVFVFSLPENNKKAGTFFK